MSDLLRRLERGPSMLAQEEATARIRELEKLLDECEEALTLAQDWMHTDWDEHDEACWKVEATLNKLQATQEQADEQTKND